MGEGILRVYPVMQQWVVRAGSETFRYLKIIIIITTTTIIIKETTKVFLHKRRPSRSLSQNLLLMVPVSYIIVSFRSSLFVSVVCYDATNLVLNTVITESKEISFSAEGLL